MNRILEAIREGSKSKLVIGTVDSPIIHAHESVAVLLPLGVNKLLVKSIEVTCSKQVDFRVEFFEESSRVNSRYNSGIVNAENYDVLDLPYIDKEDLSRMYFLITSESDYDASYSIEVRGLEMK